MFKFILIVVIFWPLTIVFFIKAKLAMNKKDSTIESRYKVVKEITETLSRVSGAKVETHGIENLPENDGYVLLVNHQGRYDAIAVMQSSDRPVTFLIDEKRSNVPFEKTIVDTLGCVRIDKEHLGKMRTALKKMNELVKSGVNVAVFPEGKYGKNGNNLQEFQTGAITVLTATKCTFVPVCLFDSYKVYDVNTFKKVTCQVHYLEPITYEQYKGMPKSDLAELVKSRINDKLSELKGEPAHEKAEEKELILK